MKRWLLAVASLLGLWTTCASAPSDPFALRPKLAQPLSLQEAVEIALRESPVLRGAVAELQAAEERWKMAQAEKQWQFALSAFATTGTRSGIVSSPAAVMPSATMALPSRSLGTISGMVMLPLFTGGRLEALIRQAETIRHATAAQLDTLRLEVALETKLAYRRALLMREMIRVAEAYLQAMEERVRIDKVAVEVGRIPEFWLLRSEAERANAQQMLVNAQRDYELALIALKVLMGIHPDSPITLSDTLETSASPLPDLDRNRLLAEALRSRPEVRSALWQVEAQSAAAQAAKALFAPQISVMAMTDYMRGRGELGQGMGGYLVGLIVGWTVFDGGRRKAMLNEVRAMREKAKAEVEQVKLQIAQEVDTALQELRAALQNVRTAEAALKAAKEDERVAKVRYEAGRSVLVEYLDAVATFLRAQVNYAQALYDLAIAHDKLLRALGKW